MEEYEFDMSAEDIGEILTIIRVQYLRLHIEPLAKKLNVKPSVIELSEEGRGPHAMLVLKKLQENFKGISFSMKLQLK
tara:strand:- start:806 stop:1039 length:234 start_codon:yes stop_codon:yes gene_type:complete